MSDTLPADEAMRLACKAGSQAACAKSSVDVPLGDLDMEFLAAAIRALDAAGWQCVPKVATLEMKIAAGDIGDGFGLTANQVIAVWSPLLAAAPRLIGDKT